ncbi:sulfurtransferase [Comamonas terrigena]|uniref:sulfurtransferase n=1 Tax=Comamonas terrigena TaxID=32013 RepID=UPI002449F498|nr:sulfurtransferase [Comamonas terrigena]MDH1700233.1 sulfurtransferase [Comamonas terrigena]
MSNSPLISAEGLKAAVAAGEPVVVLDVSYDLSDPDAGLRAYLEMHIPGALYADLGDVLSAHHRQSASGGRHPLPQRAEFASWVASQGVSNSTHVVVYDRNRCNFCVRLWWMLRWLGHDAVSVLDGGLQAWVATGGEVVSGPPPRPDAARFEVQPSLVDLVDAERVEQLLGEGAHVLIDARAAERYRGEVEPIDTVAGHIPGALNRPFALNFRADGRFKSVQELRAEFTTLLPANYVGLVNYCGSGVSATPNVLALELAGLGPASLYAGSWSDWSRRPGSAVEKGAP